MKRTKAEVLTELKALRDFNRSEADKAFMRQDSQKENRCLGRMNSYENAIALVESLEDPK